MASAGRRVLERLGLIALGFLVSAALLGLTELLLRVAGVGEGPPAYDPMAGFSAAVPLFEPERRPDGEPGLRVSPARLLDNLNAPPQPERSFLARKPSDEFRVFVVGGSSTAGFPYPPAYAFGAWLERRLAASLPDLRIEVVNAAVAGYSSRRDLIAVREIAAHQPDLLVVYSGHNEWAERRYYSRLLDLHPNLFRLVERLAATRLFRVASHWVRSERENPRAALDRLVEDQSQEMREMFAVFSRRVEGHDYPDAEQLAQRDALYRLNLEEMVRVARAAGAAVVLVAISQNFADWEPGASLHREGLTPSEAAAWEAYRRRGERAKAAGNCRGALAAWQQALAIDAEYALLHYRVAECHRRLGEWDAARRHHRLASDLDRVPHGAPTAFNQVVRDVAARGGALVVDADAALAAESQHGLLGYDLFVDFLHPNLRGHQVIAEALAEVLREAGIPRPADQWRDTDWAPPSPDALVAADPSLRLREHEALQFTCAVARRSECVEEQAAAAARLRAALR